MTTVSAVIPTFNAGAMVVEAVSSALEQSWPDVEIVVVDDGSTDDTAQLLAQFGQRITVIHQENRGRSAARNRAIHQASGDYIAFLDADDIWYPAKLETQLADLARHPGVTWAYCQTRLVDEQGVPLQSAFWPDTFGSGTAGAHEALPVLLGGKIEISTSTVVVEKSSLLAAGLFDETLAAGEDTHLWMRLARSNGPLLYTPAILATRRVNTHTSFLERLIGYGYAQSAPQILLKGVGDTSESPEADALAHAALAKAFLDSAFIELTQGRRETALHYWQEASARLDSAQLAVAIPLRLAVFSLAAARYHRDGPQEAERILRRVCGQFPAVGWTDWRTEKAALSQLYAAIAHMFALKHDQAAATRYARRAILADRRQIRNIGLLKKALFIG